MSRPKILQLVALLAGLVAVAAPAAAQITIPNTFVNGATADATTVNANFTALGASALNRTGGTMTGTLTSRAITPSATATYSLGDGTHKYVDGNFSGAVNSATGVFSSTVTAASFIGNIATSTWTGLLAIANGGTNSSVVPTAGGVIYGTGTAYGVTAAGTSGQFLVSNGAGAPSFQTINSVPSTAVFYIDGAACPSGYTELTAARGRVLVGMPAGGTLDGSVGTALTNMENRATGQHNHTATSVVTDPTHHHSAGNFGVPNAAAGADVNALAGGATTSNDATGVTVATSVDNSGSVAGTNAPYYQLLVCKKS